ncbi:hypothetical protein [Actinobaculum sp. 352]|uniref:hypothetical protein n=1 Tax=Actinobaculum sp. 352 TaxID=2490946 RepID=UPI000F7E3D92|nr:hypothetical protein [Actinobaculum sp. 352]RTE48819.1 hypothetical protein EKN07_08940 [Actinobaculum sp. 352]
MRYGDYATYWRNMELPRRQLVRDLMPYSPEDPNFLLDLIPNDSWAALQIMVADLLNADAYVPNDLLDKIEEHVAGDPEMEEDCRDLRKIHDEREREKLAS